ncbi:hypothetical protein M1O56_04010 [Dehalococcoidia bacterium]|nr:hypothetical protein [Dehalococcoidia bacterium]
MMAYEFTVEEIREVIRAARVFAPGFSEEQFQALTELQARFADSGYLEAVSGLAKLEKEKGVHLTQVLEIHDELLRENEELEKQIADRDLQLQAFEGHLQRARKKHLEVIEAIQDATTRLQKLKDEQTKEEKQLAAFKRKAAGERQRIKEELAEHHRRADVTKADIAAAEQVKKEVARHGFTLELAFGLAEEFAGQTNARERLVEALKKHGKLTKHLAALEAEITSLEGKRRFMEGILSRLEKERDQQNAVLTQLKAEVMEKGGLVSFYQRYSYLQPLIEYLGSWNQVTFHHCLWCGALFWILRPGNSPYSTYKCPWCGLIPGDTDRNAYAAVSLPPGTPLKLLP